MLHNCLGTEKKNLLRKVTIEVQSNNVQNAMQKRQALTEILKSTHLRVVSATHVTLEYHTWCDSKGNRWSC